MRTLNLVLIILFSVFNFVFCSAGTYASDDQCRNFLRTNLAEKNVLRKVSALPFGAIPFDQIRIDHFRPAFTRGLKEAKTRLKAIRENADAPTFVNTIAALEAVDEPLAQVSNVFFSYLSMKTSPALQDLADKVNPKLARFSSSIYFDEVIFSKVEKLYASRASLGLSTEQMTLLEKTYLNFIRNGAKLDAQAKARVAAIDVRLSILSEAFKKNLNQSVNSYALVITDRAKLAGLPDSAIKAAEARAKQKGKNGAWVFTLQIPSYMPLVQYADHRSVREEIWRAFGARASSGSSDNRPLLLEIVQLRQERAKILGYSSHAHYKTEDRMAKNPENIELFLTKLADAYRPAALRDLEELREFAGHDLKPWDIAYYSEKLRQNRYGYSEEDLRPYLSLDRVVEGAFYAANRRYGVMFKPRPDLPTWHESVRAYEVQDRQGGFLTLFYLDPFPRESKRPGAWMTTVQDGGEFGGLMQRPHVLNVTNVTPPIGDEPALLKLSEVTTIFHELGHGLHAILSQVRSRTLSGTNVAWDFVELPSQMNENWATEPEVLDVYARHYKTDERIPNELVEKVRKAANFQAGLMGLRQVSMGMLDLAWHAGDFSEVKSADDVNEWERKVMQPYRVFDAAGSLTSPAFSHIFAGGYSAGYYSYKWADVLAADTFDVFKRNGIFDQETSDRFRREILEKGGTENPAELYRRFRGRDAELEALLKAEGIIPAAKE